MDNFLNMLGRLGLLAVALALCGMKYLYTFTLEVHETGGGAAYNLVIHDVYVVMTAWTVLLAVLVLSTGAASVKDMGSLKFLHSTYFLTMAIVSSYSLFNDVVALLAVSGAHSLILLIQIALEVTIVLFMGQQLLAALRSVGERASHSFERGK